MAAEGVPPRYEHASFVAGSADRKAPNLFVFAGARQDGPVSDMWRLDWGKVLVRLAQSTKSNRPACSGTSE